MKKLIIKQPAEAQLDENARHTAMGLKARHGYDPDLVVSFEELTPADNEATPQISVQIDMVNDKGASFAGGFMLQLAFSSNDATTHALFRGHRMGKDMYGVFPCAFRADMDLGEMLWLSADAQLYLERVTGLDRNQLDQLQGLPATHRLEAARRLFPHVQNVWNRMRDEAAQASLLGEPA